MWFTWVIFASKAVQRVVRDGTSLSTTQSAQILPPLTVPCTKAWTLTFIDPLISKDIVVALLLGKYASVSAWAIAKFHLTPMVMHIQVPIRPTGSSSRKWSRQLLEFPKQILFWFYRYLSIKRLLYSEEDIFFLAWIFNSGDRQWLLVSWIRVTISRRKTDIARIGKRWVRYQFFKRNLMWNSQVRFWLFLELHVLFFKMKKKSSVSFTSANAAIFNAHRFSESHFSTLNTSSS